MRIHKKISLIYLNSHPNSDYIKSRIRDKIKAKIALNMHIGTNYRE